MFFTIRRQGRLAQPSGDPASGIASGTQWRRTSHAFVACASLAFGIAALKPHAAFAQSMPSAPTAPAVQAVATPMPAATANQTNPSTPPPADGADPISRFLSDKGLLPNTKPVVELAQQVRDKATDVASELVISAMNFLGVPYRRGGTSEQSGFDCSGFTRHVFENSVGLILPRRAIEQANSPELIPVQKSELKPGDLVFFNTLRHTFSHVGIYIGDDKFIHSPRAGGQVRVEDMRQAYWQQRYDGARRAPAITARQQATPPNN